MTLEETKARFLELTELAKFLDEENVPFNHTCRKRIDERIETLRTELLT